MSNLVIYHKNCLDGFAAGLAAWLKLGDQDTEYLPMGYDDPVPDVAGKDVWVLDFSFKRNVLLGLHAQANSILVLDHHKSAQEDLEGLDFAVFDMDMSGAMLAWEHFHPEHSPPLLFKYVQDRDLWQFEMDGTRNFTAALYSLVQRDFHKWAILTTPHGEEDLIPALISQGATINFVFEQDLLILAKKAHPLVIGGVFGFGCNAPTKFSSDLGNLLAKKGQTFGATYAYDGIRLTWDVSLRSTGDFDVSELAKKFGGGGHQRSAGFTIKNLAEIHTIP